MRRLKKTLIGIGGTLGVLAGGLALVTAVRQNRTFEAPTPDIHASADPAVVEHGRALVFGAAHCASCHGAPDQQAALRNGAEIPLTGGVEFHLPVGTFRTPNITSDPVTGIGRYSDSDIARMLRYGVRPDGRVLLPFMPFANLSDEDLSAVISFLRATSPVRHEVEPHQVNALGAIVKAFVLKPKGPDSTPIAKAPSGPTTERGRYLVHSVANCVGCHTKVDMRTGAFSGPLLGGGATHPVEGNDKKKYVTPNLTPDPRWGWITSWPEDVFVARVHVGRIREDSPMPWDSFRRMSDDDLRSIYQYLRTVPPVAGGPDPSKTDSVVLEGDAQGQVAQR